MKFVLLFLLASCATRPVTYEHWRQCEMGCGLRGAKEACVTFIKGPACSCYGGFTFWVDEAAIEDVEFEEFDLDIMGD